MAKGLALPVEHGDLVKEVTSGFTGTAHARTEWMNGCVRWLIIGDKVVDGEFKEMTADEQLVQVVKKRGVITTASYRATIAARKKTVEPLLGSSGGGGRADAKPHRTPR